MPPTRGSLKQPATSSRREQQLLSSLSFYGAYHFEFWNRVVHCIFVPAIWWSAALALQATGPLDSAAGFVLPGGVPLTAATLFWCCCAAVYVYLEPLGGCAAAVFYYLLLFHTHELYLSFGHSAALQLALIVHAISWFAQVVVGHALIEKRRPALLQSLLPSLLLAPFFVVLEVAFGLGYKPALHAKLLAATRRELGKLRAQDK